MPKRKYGTGPLTGTRKSSRPSGPTPKALTRKYPKRNYKASLKLSKPFRQVIDKYIDKTKQTHWVQQDIPDTGVQGIPFLQTSGAPSGVIQLVPSIHQVGQTLMGGGIQVDNLESREGSQVKLKSFTVNLSIRMRPSYGNTQDYMSGIRYKILVLSCKKVPDFKDLMGNYFWDTAGSPNLQTELFLEGATPHAWGSLYQNFQNPVNTNLFTVHAEKTGTLTRGMIQGDATGSAAHMPLAVHNLKLRLKCKSRILKFDEPTAVQPSNYQPFLWVGYQSYDGSSLHSGNFVHIVGNAKIGFDDMS